MNIESLCSTPDGKKLLIGFRNPIPDGKALIVPLENPENLLKGEAAKIGEPILLSLGGLGIRSMEYCEALSTHLIVGGPYGDERDFKLYLWSGVTTEDPRIAQDITFQDLNPEALVVYAGEKTIQVLSDDGTKKKGEEDCKEAGPEMRGFRSLWLPLVRH